MDKRPNQYNSINGNIYPVNNAYISQNYSNQVSQKSINKTSSRVSNNYASSAQNYNYTVSQPNLNQSQVINNSNNMPINFHQQKSHSSTLILSNSNDSQVNHKNKNQTYPQNSGEISTKILHQKIHYLQRQLHQLTKLLQQESRMQQSGGGSNYQQLAIQNAQLTIKTQQLQQTLDSYKHKLIQKNQDLKQTSQELQSEHQANIKLRQGLLNFQYKMQKMQNELQQYKNNQNNQNSTSSIQNDILKLNQQISDLLQKLHLLNEQYNQEQLAKEQVMQKLNQQNLVVQNLRREISQSQINVLQLKEQNNYLKQQIAKIDQMSLAKQRQIQDKYIKEQVESKYYYQKVQAQNHSLLSQIKSYEQRIEQSQNQIQSLKIKTSRVSKSNKQLVEQRLLGQIKELQDQLQTQKQKEAMIREKYTKVIQELQDSTKQYQIENRKLKLEIRKLENQINQNKNIISDFTLKVQKKDQSDIQIERLKTQIKQILSNKKLHEQTIHVYQTTIKSLQERLQSIQNHLQQKLQELDEKQYLTTQLHELQQKHEELLEQVRKLKAKNAKIQNQSNLNQRQISLQVNEHKQRTFELQELTTYLRQQVSKLQDQLKSQRQKKQVRFQDYYNVQIQGKSQKKLKLQVQKLTQQVNRFIQWRQKIQQIQQAKLIQTCKKQGKCQNCQSVLRQFLIYKQLQEIKMQYLVNHINVGQKNSQNQELLRQKIMYEEWIKKYSKNQQNYNIIQERIWEWQKLQSANESFTHIFKIQDHKNLKQNKNSQYLKDLEYDLNLIKIQNSSLRGQIKTLEQDIRHNDSRYTINNGQKQKASNEVQIKLLNEDNRFLHQQNSGLKMQLKNIKGKANQQFVRINKFNEKMQQKQKQINNLKRQLRESQTTIQSLQSQVQYEHQLTVRSRLSTQQLQSGTNLHHPHNGAQFNETQILDRHNLPYQYVKYHPQHKKLQNQFIQLKRCYLQLQLHNKKQRQLFQDQIKKLEIQKKYHKNRIVSLQSQLISYNQEKGSLICVNNTIGHNQSHNQSIQRQYKQLMTNFTILEHQLNAKRQRCALLQKKYEQLLAKFERQDKLEIGKNSKLLSSNQKQRTISQQSNINIGKIQVSPIKSPSWDNYQNDDISQEDQLQNVKNNNHRRRIRQAQQEVDLLKRRINKYNKDVQNLKQIIDSKIMELNITPRQPTNALSRAIWFIQRVSTDMKQLKIDLQILKGQKRALLKQRNILKEDLQNQFQKSNQQKPFYSNNYNNHHVKSKLQQDAQYEIAQKQFQQSERHHRFNFDLGSKSNKNNGIPKLNLAQNNSNVLFSFNANGNSSSNYNNEMQINSHEGSNERQNNSHFDVLNQAELLKNQRRNKLNMFKQQIMMASNSYGVNSNSNDINVKVY